MSTWHELTLVGPRDALEALLLQGPLRAVTDVALDLEEESLGERLLEAIRLDMHHRLYLPESEVPALLDRLREHPALRLEGRRGAVRGRFGFRAETPSRKSADAIHAELGADLPNGVRLLGLEESREVDPSASGVHLYDRAAHDFVYEARGEAEGPAPGIFELHRRFENLGFVHAERIRIEAEPLPLA